jgi:hypothetical protein
MLRLVKVTTRSFVGQNQLECMILNSMSECLRVNQLDAWCTHDSLCEHMYDSGAWQK